MKQVVRKVIDKKGKVNMVDMPTPHMGDDQVLISVHYSLVSSGTESSTLSKTPTELAKQVIKDPWMRGILKNLVLGSGIDQTLNVVRNELNLLRAFGYSGSGKVIGKGKNVKDLMVGDRVAFAAQGHAEQVAAYANHVVKIPDEVELKHAAFVTVGAIALQGVRRSESRIGDWVVVYGLGLVGQMTTQLLLASGAKVIGIDINPSRAKLAESVGLRHVVDPRNEDAVAAVMRITSGKGADATIICASSRDPSIANNAMKMTRKQGRVVFVGLVKMDLERMPFFLNELDLSFSRAYGPGSYDSSYEKGRIDYPYHYVRWTEKRNLAEVIRLIGEKRIRIEPLIDTIYPFTEVQKAFDRIGSPGMKSVAVLFSYDKVDEVRTKVELERPRGKPAPKGVFNLGIAGVGNFMRNIQMPNLGKNRGFRIRALCSASGTNAASVAESYGAEYLTSDYAELLSDPQIDAVVISTRHDLHAKMIREAAKAGKHVFVEKPVALDLNDLKAVKKAVEASGVHFMAGYNRRYSPLSQAAYGQIRQRPIMMRYTVNIQHLPDSHWTLDPVEGGGRLLGESDHFFDLMDYFASSRPIDVQAHALPITGDSNEGLFNCMVQVRYENDCIGSLTYTSLGGPKLPRESVELFLGGRHVQIHDFKSVSSNGKTISQGADMGHKGELEAFYKRLSGDEADEGLRLEETFWAGWVALQADRLIRGGGAAVGGGKRAED